MFNIFFLLVHLIIDPSRIYNANENIKIHFAV